MKIIELSQQGKCHIAHIYLALSHSGSHLLLTDLILLYTQLVVSAVMCSVGFSNAQVYVLRNKQKQMMKGMEEQRVEKDREEASQEHKPKSCLLSKITTKIHPRVAALPSKRA